MAEPTPPVVEPVASEPPPVPVPLPPVPPVPSPPEPAGSSAPSVRATARLTGSSSAPAEQKPPKALAPCAVSFAGARPGEDGAAVAEAMAATEVTAFAVRPFSALSGGERARVALARVLAQRAPLLMLDEPTAALDLRHQELVLRLCRERARAGDAVVVVLHDLGLAAACAHRVAVLRAGRVTADGAPEEVFTEDLLTEVYDQPVEVLPHPRTGAVLVLPVREE